MLLFDTCSLLWLVADQSSLSEEIKGDIRRHPLELFVSAISAYEIAEWHTTSVINLPKRPVDWFKEVLQFHAIKEIPVSAEISLLAAQLPPLHSDLCDRLIIATALHCDLKVISPDPLLQQYPELKIVF